MNSSAMLRQLTRVSRQAFNQYHAPVRISQPGLIAQRQSCFRHLDPKLARPNLTVHQIRCASSASAQQPLTNRSPSAQENLAPEADDLAARKAQEPAYELTFTCQKCSERSSHRITKQAYHFGTTLITCPGCKNRHLISDHLKIFSDKGITLEDIMKEKGQLLKKGSLNADGDIEFYDDASATDPAQPQGEKA